MTAHEAIVDEAPGVVVSGTTTRIPVRNLWLLMLYASELFRHERDLQSAGMEENSDELLDVVAEILVSAVERRLQRGLGRGYRDTHAVLTRVRGRIDTLSTESRMLLAQGRVACRFDELTVDNPPNRLLLTALRFVSRRCGGAELKRRARGLASALMQYGVSSCPIDQRAAVAVTLGRNDVDDREAVDAAKLLLEMMVFTEDDGRQTARAPMRDAKQIRGLYEKAVRGFYRTVLPPEWTVGPGNHQLEWPRDAESSGLHYLLPKMLTDIELERAGRRVVVETKFADALKPGRPGEPGTPGKLRLSRDHLFQIYAYIQSQHDADLLGARAEGVLLYPAVGQHVDEWAVIQGHRYRYLTVDLAAPTAAIRRRLLEVVDEPATRGSGGSRRSRPV